MNDAFELNTIYVVADKLECNCFSEYIVFFTRGRHQSVTSRSPAISSLLRLTVTLLFCDRFTVPFTVL